jgi:hypothetical protein
MDVVSVYMRGLQPLGSKKPDWRVEITFSGCGGAAEVSSMLAAHWAEIWRNEEKSQIDEEILIPFGFLPALRQPNYKWPPFVPIPGGSYAVYDETQRIDEDDSPFQINVALADSLEDSGRQLVKDLEIRYSDLFAAEKKCRCQLCMPDLDS